MAQNRQREKQKINNSGVPISKFYRQAQYDVSYAVYYDNYKFTKPLSDYYVPFIFI